MTLRPGRGNLRRPSVDPWRESLHFWTAHLVAKLRRPLPKMARRFEPGCDFGRDRIRSIHWMLFIRYQANGEKEN